MFYLPGGTCHCHKCLEWHYKQLEVIETSEPLGCTGCYKTPEQLRELAVGSHYELTLHRKDGVLQMLCGECNLKHLKGCRVHFEGTQAGEKLKRDGIY